MVLIKDNTFKKALINHRKEITELKEKIEKISKLGNTNGKPEIPIGNSANQEQELRIKVLENQLKTVNETYTTLLEKLLEIIGNRKSEMSESVSNSEQIGLEDIPAKAEKPPKPPKTPDFGVDSYQILFLLEKSKANSPEFAVSSNQLKTAFNIKKSEKTLRNRLLLLANQGYISTTGQKPKKFFLTRAGLTLISQQQNLALK